MKEYITVHRDANAIRLARETFFGSFLLVEGRSDKLFYERFIDEDACRVMSYSHGRPSVKIWTIDVLRILEEGNFQGVAAIVDADFDCLENLSHSPNLIYTDTHDLETMLVSSPAFEKILTEFSSKDKLTKFPRDIRSVLLNAGKIVGYLRWISQVDELNLSFEEIKFSSFIDMEVLEIDQAKLIREVKNKSQAFELNDKDIMQQIAEKASCGHDLWQVCCGHDLVNVLHLGLRKAIGSAKASDVEPNMIERSLRLAYEDAYFCKTRIYSSICLWECKNQPFKVFKGRK